MIDDILQQAAAEARGSAERGWIDISSSIRHRLKTVTRRTRPLRAATDSGALIYVTDHVLISQLRRRIAGLPGCELDGVRLIGDDDTCTGAVVDVVVTTYGQDLRLLADQVRSLVDKVFTDLLGPVVPPFGDDGVDITITDLTLKP